MSLFYIVGIHAIRLGFTGLLYMALTLASLCIASCGTQKLYHGVEATDLASLQYGMNRNDVEKYTGTAKREFHCASGTIVTYVYDRGYAGCIKDETCDPEKENAVQITEVVGDVFTLGLLTYTLSECINPCQKGHLVIYFDQGNRLIGARELPTDRDEFCWDKRAEKCSRYYNYRQPSSVSKDLILDINLEDIPDKICDQFEQ